MAELRSSLSAPLLRGLEPLLPLAGYLAVLYPVAFVRALIYHATKKCEDTPLPSFLSPPLRRRRLPRMSTYLNRTFEFIPDRLNSDKWQARCRYIGLEPVLEALEAGRPIVFTFAHFGPYELFRSWMRAMGIPVAMLAGGNASSRSRLRLQKDRWAIFPNAKTAFHLNELPDAVRRFKTGQPLAMAFDVSRKRQTRVPLPDGWTFIMATGAIRLARKHGAQLFPCAIYNESPWRFTVEIAPAVPEKLLAQDEQITAKDILDKLLPIFEQHPDDWHPQLSGNFVPPPTD